MGLHIIIGFDGQHNTARPVVLYAGRNGDDARKAMHEDVSCVRFERFTNVTGIRKHNPNFNPDKAFGLPPAADAGPTVEEAAAMVERIEQLEGLLAGERELREQAEAAVGQAKHEIVKLEGLLAEERQYVALRAEGGASDVGVLGLGSPPAAEVPQVPQQFLPAAEAPPATEETPAPAASPAAPISGSRRSKGSH